MFQLTIQSRHISVEQSETLICGEVNAVFCRFTFDAPWEGLQKTIVFSNGDTSILVPDQQLEDGVCAIPHEVLREAKKYVFAGVEGRQGNTLIMRTEPEFLGFVCPSLDTDCAETADPTLPVWQQLQDCIGDLRQLQTQQKLSLVAAINEAAAAAGGVQPQFSITEISGGHRVSIVDVEHPEDAPLTFDIPQPQAAPTHGQLSGRESSDQHPISAITGLQNALDAKQAAAIADAGGYFTAQTVEGALQELGAELSGVNTLLGSGFAE